MKKDKFECSKCKCTPEELSAKNNFNLPFEKLIWLCHNCYGVKYKKEIKHEQSNRDSEIQPR